MEMLSEKEVIEEFTQDVCTVPERAPSTSNSSDTNFTITEMEFIEISLEDEEKYGLKTCLVELERCDKIWETIQLIRQLQDDPNVESCIETDENMMEENPLPDELEPFTNDEASNNEGNTEESDPLQISNTLTPYIKYQPVLNNGNAALPNFQFSVQRTRILYPCLTCGKQYSHTRSLREHSEKVHNIRIPSIRKKNENGSDTKTIIKIEPNDLEYLHESESNSVEPTNDSSDLQTLEDEESTNKQNEIQYNYEKIINGNLNIFSCPFCDKSYRDKYTLNKHLKKIHGKQIGLTRAYRRKQTSMNSENTSCKIRQVKPFRSLDIQRCKTCGKHLYGTRNLRKHCRKVHGIYVRPKGNLPDHHKLEKTEESEKNNEQASDPILNTDSKTTTNNTSIVTNRKPIRRCPVCNKLYRDHLAWKNHCKKEHGMTIQFVSSFPTELGQNNDCIHCNKRFYKPRDILEHYKVVHHQHLRYKCELCESLFHNTKSLTRHSSNVHKTILLLRRNSKQLLVCNKCGILCINKSDLEFHRKQEHPNECLPKNLNIQKSFQQRRLKASDSRRKLLRRKIINGGTSSSNSDNTNQPSEASQSSENTSEDILYMTNCILCGNRQLKFIREHFMKYHKVRNPEALIAQCSKTPIEPTSPFNCNNVNDNVKDIKPKVNTLKQLPPNKPNMIFSRKHKCISEDRFFLRISQPHEKKLYACKYCPFTSNDYEEMRKDEKRHKREGITSETKPLYDHVNNSATNGLSSFILNRKRKCESIDNRNTRRRKLSPTLTQIRTTRASVKIKEEYYHICSLCGRTFRTTEILKSHKVSCMARPNQPSGGETSDTRESSDRDSGIGISITIKKKNDSYEIVNRENDDKVNNETDIKAESDQPTLENSSNILLAATTNPSEQSDKSFEYSKYHEFVKIEQGEDSDVDIGSDLENQNSINLDNQESQAFKSDIENCHSEIDNKKTDTSNHHKSVPSLKMLCQKALNKPIEETTKPMYKCDVCFKVWDSVNARNAHKKIHIKYRKKQVTLNSYVAEL